MTRKSAKRGRGAPRTEIQDAEHDNVLQAHAPVRSPARPLNGQGRVAGNSVQPSRLPERQSSGEKVSSGRAGDAAPARARGRAARGPNAHADAMPDEVKKRFVAVGRTFYFHDGAKAFTDLGKRLVTQSENTEVVRTLIAIAQARHWADVTVTGTERFRREAWASATAAGLKVRGYTPTEFEKERWVRSMAPQGTARDRSARSSAPEQEQDSPTAAARASERRATRPVDDLIVGRLVDHGAAPYKHKANAERSYFVRVETSAGDRVVWGVDLERALRESLTAPAAGDRVGVRSVGREPVTVTRRERDGEGQVVGETPKQAHRNRWLIEKQAFFESRVAAARVFADTNVSAEVASRERPELLGSYLQLRAAEEVARSNVRDPQDQARFVSLVRDALTQAIARGEPLPPVRMRERDAPRTALKPHALERDAPAVRS